jgi:hypothetical protein
MPAVSGSTAVIVLIAIAVVVGLGAASLLAAVRGERLDDTPLGRHHGVALLVGLGYLGLAAFVIYTINDAAR